MLPVKQTETKFEIDFTKVKYNCLSENFTFMWTFSTENLILLYVNNKGADQSLHPHNLVSAFVFREGYSQNLNIFAILCS